MARNNLATLNNYMFEMVERIMDEDQTAEERKAQVETANAISNCAKTILENARLELEVMKLTASEKYYVEKKDVPELLKLEDR